MLAAAYEAARLKEETEKAEVMPPNERAKDLANYLSSNPAISLLSVIELLQLGSRVR